MSAAEGFIFLSGLLAGFIFTRHIHKAGWQRGVIAIYRRVGQIYFVHIGCVIFFLAGTQIMLHTTGSPPPNVDSVACDRPLASFIAALALLNRPGLLDILPLYCVFLAALPITLWLLETKRHALLFTASVVLYIFTNIFRPQHPNISGVFHSGAFNLGAWQLLFTGAAFFGHQWANGRPFRWTPPPWFLIPLAGLALVFMATRHGYATWAWDSAFRDWMTNKNNLAPFRLLNVSILFLFAHLLLRDVRHIHFLRPFTLMGRHSLAVFAVHVVMVLVVHAFPNVFNDSVDKSLTAPTILLTFMILTAAGLEHRKQRGQCTAAIQTAQPGPLPSLTA